MTTTTITYLKAVIKSIKNRNNIECITASDKIYDKEEYDNYIKNGYDTFNDWWWHVRHKYIRVQDIKSTFKIKRNNSKLYDTALFCLGKNIILTVSNNEFIESIDNLIPKELVQINNRIIASNKNKLN